MKSKYSGIDISLIEAKVPEEIAIKTEELADTGSVSGLQQKVKGRWEATVIDNNMHFSILLEVKSDKLVSCKCNCNTYAGEGICAHVILAIVNIRKRLSEIKSKPLKKGKKTRSKSPNIAGLLSQLSREEIEDFIISKTRSDRNFKLLIQGRFIEKMPESDLESFIETTFPILTKANEKVSASKLKTFVDITEELNNHFKTLVSQDDFIEAYNLAFLLLKKSFYIKHHLRNDRTSFFKLHKNLLSNYIEVYRLIEAPEYKEGILDQLEKLLGASYISATLAEEKELWMLLYQATERRSHLRDITKTFLLRGRTDDYNSYYFIKMLELILHSNDDEKISAIQQKDMQESYRLIQYLKDFSQFDKCQEALHLFYVHKLLNHPLAKLVIETIDIQPDKIETLTARTITYFLKYKEDTYLSFLKQLGSNWRKTKRSIVKAIKETNDPALLVKFYIQDEDMDAAIKYMREHLSWALLREFDRDIAGESADECLELYYTTLEDYIRDHFGMHAQEFTRQAFNRITAIGYKKWLPLLKERLVSKFPERKSVFQF